MTRTRISAALAVLALLPAACGGSGGSSSGTSPVTARPLWGQYRGNDRNQGRSAGLGPRAGAARFSTDLGAPVVAPVTIGGQGTLRARTSAGEVVALSPDGAILWRATVGPGNSAPVLDARDACYVGGTDGTVVKLDAKGTRRWTASLGADPGSGLLFEFDRILFAGTDGALHFLDTNDGSEVTLSVGAVADSMPVSTQDQQLFVASTDGRLYEIQLDPASGTPAVGASLVLPGPVSACCPASIGSLVYVVTDQDVLVKCYKDRFGTDPPKIVWTYDPASGTSSGGRSSPAIGRDGTVYYGTADGRLIAVRSDGVKLWSYAAGAPIRSSPALDGQDDLFFRTVDGILHSLTAAGQVRFVQPRVDTGVANLDPSPTLDDQGRLYLGTHTGHVLGIGGGPVWGEVGGSAAHRSRFADQGPAAPELDWALAVGTTVDGPLLVDEDGRVVFLGGDGVLHTLVGAGLLGTDVGFSSFVTHVVLGPADAVHATTNAGDVQGYRLGGGLLYSTHLVDSGTLTAPAVAADGSLRVGSSTGALFSLTADGLPQWQVGGAVLQDNAPAVRADGSTVVADASGRLQEFDALGRRTRLVPLPGPVTRSSPVIAPDGSVLVLTDDDVVVAVGPDGRGRWQYDPQEAWPGGGAGGPMLSDDLVTFVTAGGTWIGRQWLDGVSRFRFTLGAAPAAPPVADDAGRLYVLTVDGGLHRSDGAGTTPVTLAPQFQGALGRAPVPCGSRGLLLVSDQGEALRLADDRSWSTFHGGPEHAGLRLQSLPLTGTVDWSIPLGGTPELSPVMDRDGNVLVHTTEGELLIVDAAGTVQQRLSAGPGPGLPAVMDAAARVFTGAGTGVLTAFSTGGASLWFVALPGALSGLVMDRQGHLLLGAAGQLRAFAPDGDELWTTPVGSLGEGAVAVAPDGRLLAANLAGELRAFDEDGDPLWTATLPGAVSRSTPLVAPDGTAYVTTDADVLVAVGTDGLVRWTLDPGTGSNQGGRAAPGRTHAGLVVFGAMDGFLRAVDGAGNVAWSFDAGAAIRSAPVVDGRDHVFFGAEDGALYALQADGSLEFRLDLSGGLPGPLSSPVLAADGALYVASGAGNLFRIR